MILPEKVFCPKDGLILNSCGVDNFRKCAKCGGAWQIECLEFGAWTFTPLVIKDGSVSLKLH